LSDIPDPEVQISLISLYPLAIYYGGYIDNLLAYASTPRLHCLCSDSVIGLLLAVSVFSYPDDPLSPPLYTKVVNLYVGETRFNSGFLCAFNHAPWCQDLVYFGFWLWCWCVPSPFPFSPSCLS